MSTKEAVSCCQVAPFVILNIFITKGANCNINLLLRLTLVLLGSYSFDGVLSDLSQL